jgi:predicted Rossmann-fold nucleotide-binding protein
MARWSAWRKKTAADITDPAGFAAWKAEGSRYVVGVMGYSGAWRRSGLTGEALADFVAKAEQALEVVLLSLREAHGERLVVCSGATDIGVPGLAYALCARLGITTAGITAGAAQRYRLATMEKLVVIGRRFGDESAVFVAQCDAFVVLGGGAQSAAECRLAMAAGKPVTAIRGFGGAADALPAEDSPQPPPPRSQNQ